MTRHGAMNRRLWKASAIAAAALALLVLLGLLARNEWISIFVNGILQGEIR